MRYLLMSLIAVAALFTFCSSCLAVGVYTPGQEKYNCSSLVQRGIIPDAWNKLTEALLIPQISWAIDKLTIETKAVIGQFGQPPSTDISSISSSKADETKELKDEPLPLVKETSKKLDKKPKKPLPKSAKANLKKSKQLDKKDSKPKKRIKAPLKAL
ncbi:MAG: hypothetical protein V1897_11430 [Pseudomonadota bacterium]